MLPLLQRLLGLRDHRSYPEVERRTQDSRERRDVVQELIEMRRRIEAIQVEVAVMQRRRRVNHS